MRPIDIQNAIDHVQAAERILHVRKVEEGEYVDYFAKSLSEQVEHKTTSVPDTEHAEGLKVDEKGGKKHPPRRHKREKDEEKESKENHPRIKEDGKGDILDINA